MLFEVILRGLYFGQEVINRWNYTSTSTPASVTPSFGLVSAFGGIPDSITHAFPDGSIMAAIASIQATALVYTDLTAINIYDKADFYSVPYTSAQHGLNASGDAMTPINAYGWKSTQVTRAIRAGHKRIAGVCEGDVDAGGVLSASILPTLTTIAGLFGSTINYTDEGATLAYVPVIVSKEKYTVPSSGKTAYKYWPDLAAQSAHLATGVIWTPMPDVRSQTSRQYGKGK